MEQWNQVSDWIPTRVGYNQPFEAIHGFFGSGQEYPPRESRWMKQDPGIKVRP